MKIKNLLLTLIPISLVFILSGCAIQKNESLLIPNADETKMKFFYVVHNEVDKRNIDQSIAEVLVEKGYIATSGKIENIPEKLDVLVTYEDRWMWDMGNYLIQLDIQFRNPLNNYPFIAGENVRTSLIRKSPQFMADETITIMLKKIKESK